MAKDPLDYGEVHPAFIEITLNLRPASKFSDATLQKFAHGSGAFNYRNKEVKIPIKPTITPRGAGSYGNGVTKFDYSNMNYTNSLNSPSLGSNLGGKFSF